MAGYYSTTLDVYNASHSTKRGELAVSWWDPLTTNSIVAGDTLWGDIEFTPIGSNAVCILGQWLNDTFTKCG